MELITNLSKVEDQIVDTIKSVQEPVVEYVRKAVEFVDGQLPELPELPFTAQLPTPEALVDNGYGFVTELLKVNHEFVKAIIAAVSPLLPEQAKPAKKTTRSTAKVAA
ncbi:MAG: hypothetical protein ACRD0U_11325 [Acidimicrobiales bacterium]